MNITNIILLFLSCSFIGWVLECLLLLYQEKRLINRGFLTGPMCPLYGAGAVSIIVLLNRFKFNALLVFVLATFLSAIIEYATSVILEKVFNTRWWDYSNEKYHINGRLNLVTLFAFGIFGLILIYFYYPLFLGVISTIPEKGLNLITIILSLIFVIDATTSLIIAFKFKEETMDMAKSLRTIDSTESIYKLKRKMIKENVFYKRLINAFPKIRFNFINEMKKKISKK